MLECDARWPAEGKTLEFDVRSRQRQSRQTTTYVKHLEDEELPEQVATPLHDFVIKLPLCTIAICGPR